jgi:hypothetical protein
MVETFEIAYGTSWKSRRRSWIRKGEEVELFNQQKTGLSGSNGGVRATRNTTLAKFSAPGLNTIRHVAYRPSIAVSLFLLALLVSYFTQKCGFGANCDHTSEWIQWVHSSIGIAMGDAAKISPCIPCTLSSRRIGRR